MAIQIGGAQGANGLSAIQRAAKSTAGVTDGGFGESLGKLLEGVEESTAEANGAVSNMLNKTGDVHDAMIAMHHAETSLQLTVQIRNKLVSAYHDIMRMPI